MRHLGARRGWPFDHTRALAMTFVATGIIDSIGIILNPNRSRLFSSIVVATCCGLVGLVVASARAEAPPAAANVNVTENPYPHHVAAPAIEGGEWVNTPAPLALADLRGRF